MTEFIVRAEWDGKTWWFCGSVTTRIGDPCYTQVRADAFHFTCQSCAKAFAHAEDKRVNGHLQERIVTFEVEEVYLLDAHDTQ